MRKNTFRFIIFIFMFIFLSGCSLIRDNASDNIYNFIFPTSGTVIDDEGSIQMRTALEDNRFSYVVLQLYTDVPKKHIKNIVETGEGKQRGLYTHKLETGCYIITLKGNSNKLDEGVDMRVQLVKGYTYMYSFNVKLLSEKNVIIQDYSFVIA